jgi:hypothetical protein
MSTFFQTETIRLGLFVEKERKVLLFLVLQVKKA